MNLRDLAALTIKVAGWVLLVLIVARLPEYFKTYLEQKAMSGAISVWGYVVPLLIPSVAAILLITFPYRIGDFSIVKDGENWEEANLRGLELVAVRILGLLLLFWAISDLVYHVSNYLMLRSAVQDIPIGAYDYGYLIATLVELVFAIWLLVGTKGIVDYLREVRRS